MKLFSLLIFFFFSFRVYGFEILPEYRSIRSNEPNSIENFMYIDSEYDSDYLSYLNSFKAERNFRKYNVGAFGSVGSLSSKEFFHQSALKLSHDLFKNFNAQFMHITDSHFDSDYQANVIEVTYQNELFPLGASIYGEVSRDKKEDDLGVSVLWNTDVSQSRLFYLQPDFSRNKRNRNADRFKKKPMVYGLKSSYSSSRLYSDFVLRIEDQIEWEFPEQDKRYFYESLYSSFHIIHFGSFFKSVEARLDFLQKEEVQEPLSLGGPLVAGLQKIRRARALLEVNKGVHSLGTFLTSRSWQDEQKNRFQMINTQPYYWWHYHRGPARISKLGLSSSISEVSTRGAVTIPAKTSWDGRLNWGWDFLFKSKSSLSVLLTFDLDRLGKSDTWEGGNIQYQFFDF